MTVGQRSQFSSARHGKGVTIPGWRSYCHTYLLIFLTTISLVLEKVASGLPNKEAVAKTGL